MSNSLPRSSSRSLALFAIGAAILLAYYCVGIVYLDGFSLDLGSLNFPPRRYMAFVALWSLFGGAAALAFAAALSQRLRAAGAIDQVESQWNALDDRFFLVVTAAAAFAIPAVLRFVVLGGAPLADDEAAYRFAAELLASGRLWVKSPALKVFFDQNFMINDGRLYPVYFLGWPALLAIGVPLHAPGLVNPMLSALTVPALFGVLRRLAGASWAKGGVLLFLSAPFVQIAAATELSHTSCLFALTWCLFMLLRAQEEDGAWPAHAGIGLTFALAFCIRPQSAVALGLPLLVAWAYSLRRLPSRRIATAVVAFGVPAMLLAGLFLGSLWAQNGSPFLVGYARYNQYIADEHVRFTVFNPKDMGTVAGFNFADAPAAIARTGLGMFRLNFDLFGWSSSFAFMLFALPGACGRGRMLWWMVASYVSLMLFQNDWGIDTFGPVHAFELALPVVGLTTIGARHLSMLLSATTSGSDSAVSRRSALAPALFATLMITAWLGFVPVRLEAVRQVAARINLALQAPARAGLQHAVIFAPLPFIPMCPGAPFHFVYFRPVNDPDLRNDILWVNQIGPEDDRRLLDTLPGRTGYLLTWTRECRVNLSPLGR